MTTQTDHCPACRNPIIAGSPVALCPVCLLTTALSETDSIQIADYDILGRLGEGGMGVIYRAKQRSTGRVVALKVIREGKLANTEQRRLFQIEIEVAAGLQHPHIAPIYEIGQRTDPMYYTMPVYSAVLSARMERYRAPEAAATLVAMAARAVHTGHLQGVIHRDLKPDNILLDEQGLPHIADFGIAKRMWAQGVTEPGSIRGTFQYMAPEQARGSGHAITTAADQYSLGVILYELLTGSRPLLTDTMPTPNDPLAVVLEIIETKPRPLRSRAPAVPRDLETICLKCLEKEPAKRYPTTLELADDLERFLRREPISARAATVGERIWRFTRDHWLLVGASVGTILMLAVVTATSIGVASSQENDLRQQAMDTNQSLARVLAGQVSRDLSSPLKDMVGDASDARVVSLLADSNAQESCGDEPIEPEHPSRPSLPNPPVDAVLQQLRNGSSWSSITLSDRCGKLIGIALSQHERGGLLEDYGWRDHFKGAAALGISHQRGIGYISKPFFAEDNKKLKFGISVPIYKDSVWVGVIMATIGSNSPWTQLQEFNDHSDKINAFLVASPDRSRDAPAEAGQYVAVAHGELTPEKIIIPKLPTPVSDNFDDPAPGFEGRWIAGAYHVKDTPFDVIVETRYSDVVKPTVERLRGLPWRLGIVALIWSVVFGSAVWGYKRRWRMARTPELARRSRSMKIATQATTLD